MVSRLMLFGSMKALMSKFEPKIEEVHGKYIFFHTLEIQDVQE